MRLRRPAKASVLPKELLDEMGLGKEHVLASAPLVGGGGVAITPAGVRALTPRGDLVRRRWVEVDHMVWHPESSTLAVFWVNGRLPSAFELALESFVPEAAHERWRSSVLLTREVTIPAIGTVWMALRRDIDGTIDVQTNLPPGSSPTDPRVIDALAPAQLALRQEAGLPATLDGLDGLR